MIEIAAYFYFRIPPGATPFRDSFYDGSGNGDGNVRVPALAALFPPPPFLLLWIHLNLHQSPFLPSPSPSPSSSSSSASSFKSTVSLADSLRKVALAIGYRSWGRLMLMLISMAARPGLSNWQLAARPGPASDVRVKADCGSTPGVSDTGISVSTSCVALRGTCLEGKHRL